MSKVDPLIRLLLSKHTQQACVLRSPETESFSLKWEINARDRVAKKMTKSPRLFPIGHNYAHNHDSQLSPRTYACPFILKRVTLRDLTTSRPRMATGNGIMPLHGTFFSLFSTLLCSLSAADNAFVCSAGCICRRSPAKR